MDKKKLSAAIAAVTAYISSEEAMAARAALDAQASETVSETAPNAAGPVNLWGTAGRQSQMQANAMMLMRAFK